MGYPRRFVKGRFKTCPYILLLCGTVGFAAGAAEEGLSPEQETFLQELLAAPTPEARQTLLENHRETLTESFIGSLLQMGKQKAQAGNPPEGLQLVDMALEMARFGPLPKAVVKGLVQRGSLLVDTGAWEEARTCFQQARDLAQEIPFPQGLADALGGLGVLAMKQGKNEEALALFQQALSIRRETGQREGQGRTLNQIGLVYQSLGRYQEAVDYFQQARGISQEIKDPLSEASCLANLGAVYDDLGQVDQALACTEQARQLYRQNGSRVGEARMLLNLGAVYMKLRGLPQADGYLRQALEIFEEMGHREHQAMALANLGTVNGLRGLYPEAMQFYEQAEGLFRKLGALPDQAWVLIQKAQLSVDRGDYAEADRGYRQVAEWARKMQQPELEAENARHWGDLQRRQGRYEEALRLHQRAEQGHRERGDGKKVATCLMDQGDDYEALGQRNEALRCYEQAQTLWEELQDQAGQARVLNNLANFYGQAGNHDKALALYQRAQEIHRSRGDGKNLAITAGNLGALYAQLGQPEKALEQFQQALQIFQERGDPGSVAYVQGNLGALFQTWNQPEQALEHLGEAIRLARQANNPDVLLPAYYNQGQLYEKLDHLEEAQQSYGAAIDGVEDVFSRLQVPAYQRSYQAQQQVYYQALIRLLLQLDREEEAWAYQERSKARAFLNLLGNPRLLVSRGDPALMEQERRLSEQLQAQQRLCAQLPPSPASEVQKTLAQEARENLTSLRQEYERVLQRLQLTHPDLAALRTVQTLPRAEVQALLDGNTALVEYAWLGSRMAIWVLRRDSAHCVTVDLAGMNLVEEIRRVRTFIGAYEETLPRLHQLLIAPVEGEIHGATTLLIVPTGPLFFLPFSALHAAGQPPLLERYAVAYLPSAAVLKQCRERAAGKELGRLLGLIYTPEPIPSARSALSSWGECTLQEGPQASETRAKADLGQYSILHFLCHGEFVQETPLFSYLALAPDGKNDGALTAQEILSLDCPRASLAVLSACETAWPEPTVEKEGGNLLELTLGDEITGLTRSFFTAGVPSVVASLWKVDGEQTCALMQAFYGQLRAGKSKAEALRQAQLSLQEEGFQTWCPFILLGDTG